MRYVQFAPPAQLSGHIDAIWTLSECDESDQTTATILPDGAIELVLATGGAIEAGAARMEAAVVGQQEQAVRLRLDRGVQLLGIRARPAAGAALLGSSPLDFAGGIMPLRDACPELMSALAPACASRRADMAAVTSVLGALAGRRRTVAAPDVVADFAVREILASRGSVRVAALAARLDISTRQLERRFALAVGLPPKRWARVARFRAVTEAIGRGTSPSLAALAHDHGYADHAHMTREFAAFAGVPPSRAWWR